MQLAAVNAALWHAEDDMRRWRDIYQRGEQEPGSEQPCECVREVAFRIQALNDDRAKLIAKINAETGDAVGEKI